jgi:hypothetical protein
LKSPHESPSCKFHNTDIHAPCSINWAFRDVRCNVLWFPTHTTENREINSSGVREQKIIVENEIRELRAKINNHLDQLQEGLMKKLTETQKQINIGTVVWVRQGFAKLWWSRHSVQSPSSHSGHHTSDGLEIWRIC